MFRWTSHVMLEKEKETNTTYDCHRENKFVDHLDESKRKFMLASGPK